MNDDPTDDRRAAMRRTLVRAGRDERLSSKFHARLAVLAAAEVVASGVAVAATETSLGPAAAQASTAPAAAASHVSLVTAATAPVSTVGVAGTVVGAAAMWKVATVFVVLGALGGGGTLVASLSASHDAPKIATSSPAANAPALPPNVAITAPEATMPAEVSAESSTADPLPPVAREPEAAQRKRPPSGGAPKRAAEARPPASKGDEAKGTRASAARLADEMRRVEAIRSAANSGRPGEALRLLEEYRVEFPSGALSEEAEVLRIESLSRLGRTQAAAQLARRFLKERSSSPYTSRVQTLASLPAPSTE
jgi:hypothetical protein